RFFRLFNAIVSIFTRANYFCVWHICVWARAILLHLPDHIIFPIASKIFYIYGWKNMEDELSNALVFNQKNTPTEIIFSCKMIYDGDVCLFDNLYKYLHKN
ncbi:hypothetical protein ACJX0J_007785, partial [Zea mays]